MVTYLKISDLPVATEAGGADELEVNQSGLTRKITIDQVADVVADILPPPSTDWGDITGKPNFDTLYVNTAGDTMTGALGVGDHMTLKGSGNPTARLMISAAQTDGAAPPLLDLIDLNMSGATPSTGFDIRFFGRDTNNDVVLGAVINGGMATRTAGSFKGDIDFLVYGAGYTVQAGIALSGVYSGLVPISPNAYVLGDSTLRWSNVYSTLGNFSGALTGTTATFTTQVTSPIVANTGALLLQAGAGAPLSFFADNGAIGLFWRPGGLLQFGALATPATAPALKRSATTLAVRLGDDSADAGLTASTGMFSGTLKTLTSLSVGSTSASEAIDLTGNLFLRNAGSTIYCAGALAVQSAAGTALTLISAAANTLIWSSNALLQFGGTGVAAPALKRSGATSTLMVRQANDGADAPLTAASVSTSATNFLHITTGTLANGAAAAAGTLTNAPVAGNPTKWIAINDNGTTRYIPSW